MKYDPLFKNFPFIIHGADYNPEQWRNYPSILEDDLSLFSKANMNSATIGIFSWAELEPKEGQYNFSFLDEIFNSLSKNNMKIILSTPSGARPAWMSKKYPEILRTNYNRQKILHSGRHNHCLSSYIYKEKVIEINSELAKRYGNHPNLLLWHISNEYEGACYCKNCEEAFRLYLKNKYNNDLDYLNHCWWTSFWSHTYTDWNQIEAPAPHGETEVHGLSLDWKRFTTEKTIDFMNTEIKAIKKYSKNTPVTTNFHQFTNFHTDCSLNYWKFAPFLDIISWDNYPYWHAPNGDFNEACRRSLMHDMNRSFKKGQPFMLMESSPSATNWQPVSKLRKPGMHELASLQAIAHGSDSIQYFQFRKSRGSSEKFHGAVVDHSNRSDTRVFKEVASLGKKLEKMKTITGSRVESKAAILFDFENASAIHYLQGLNNLDKGYENICHNHYRNLFKQGVSLDVLDFNQDFSKYKFIIAPMMYITTESVATRLDTFTKNGGILILTYFSGIVDENDLCHLDGFPGPLRSLAGIWAEEIDCLYDNEYNHIKPKNNNFLDLKEIYKVHKYCELIHAESAEILATYTDDFYKNYPALTVNKNGNGYVYYIACETDDNFLNDFYKNIIKKHSIEKILDIDLPNDILVQKRENCKQNYFFFMNFSNKPQTICLEDYLMYDFFNNKLIQNLTTIEPYETLITYTEKK